MLSVAPYRNLSEAFTWKIFQSSDKIPTLRGAHRSLHAATDDCVTWAQGGSERHDPAASVIVVWHRAQLRHALVVQLQRVVSAGGQYSLVACMQGGPISILAWPVQTSAPWNAHGTPRVTASELFDHLMVHFTAYILM